MSIDLESLKAELEAAGHGAAIYDEMHGDGRYRYLTTYEFYVYETGIVGPPRKMFPDDFAIAAIIARHVAPAEPVTLTTDEWASMDKMLTWADVNATDVLKWLRENGFRLVRTGGVADGA